MTTSKNTKKAVHSTNNSAVTITSPKIEKAWSDLVVISTTGEAKAIEACLTLAKEMKASALSIRDIQKVIKATGLESPFVKVSHVEGLPTMLAMTSSVKGFSSLSLAKQLSTAVASYKLLGAGNGEQLADLDAVEKANAGARKAKVSAKSGSAKADTAKVSKAKATDADTLKAMTAYVLTLNLESFDDVTHDMFAELLVTIESKADAFNESLV